MMTLDIEAEVLSQTVQFLIRLLIRSSLIRRYTVCNSDSNFDISPNSTMRYDFWGNYGGWSWCPRTEDSHLISLIVKMRRLDFI